MNKIILPFVTAILISVLFSCKSAKSTTTGSETNRVDTVKAEIKMKDMVDSASYAIGIFTVNSGQ